MWRRIAAAVALAVALVPLLSASPASAGSSCTGDATTAPDGKVRIDGEPFEGSGHYPFSIASADFVPIGQSVAFTLKWKNLRPTAATIRVARDDLGLDGYASRYFVAGVNVTQKIRSGDALAFRDVAANASATMSVVVRNKSATESDQGLQFLDGKYKGSVPTACDALGPWVNNFG